MTFEPSKVNDFLEIFNESKEKIRAFPGCSKLELFQEKGNGNVMFTYSVWNSEEELAAYRNSELFSQTWNKTKKMFIEKADAWTLDSISVQ